MMRRMTYKQYHDRHQKGRAIWWTSHRVWLSDGNWFSGDPEHEYGPEVVDHVEGLPVPEGEAGIDDMDLGLANKAERIISRWRATRNPCPVCGVGVGEPCLDDDGFPTPGGGHVGRIVPPDENGVCVVRHTGVSD